MCFIAEKTFVTLQVIDEEVEADVGDEYVYLNVDLHAYPEPLLVWRKGAKVISDSDHHYDTKWVIVIIITLKGNNYFNA